MKKCVACGVKFVSDKFHPNAKTCGDIRCGRRWYRMRHVGRLNEESRQYRELRWFGGKREEVLIRDKYTCQKCGNSRGGRLTVHHKDFNGRGRPSPNNKVSNLITLCSFCHSAIHRIPPISEETRERIKNMTINGDTIRFIGKVLGVSHTTALKYKNG